MGFFLEYLRHPSTIGAVAPSSRWLARKMIEAIRFNRCKCIVEYGPGTGAFTNEKKKSRYNSFNYRTE